MGEEKRRKKIRLRIRSNIFDQRRGRRTEKEKREIFVEETYLITGAERKGGTYLKKEYILSAVEMKNRQGKERNIWRRKIFGRQRIRRKRR